jgi:hypothetical protein
MAKMKHICITAIIILLISIIAVAYIIVLSTPQQPQANKADPKTIGICVHSLSPDDAQLINQTGARWIRIDISDNQTALTASLINAKNYDLYVLGILGSWMLNQSCSFTLDQWRSAVSSNVSKYAPYVDAWEIWNEPASTEPGWQLQADYLSMVQIASPIIRSTDPTAKIVLLGGLQLYKGSPNVPAEDKAFAENLPINITDYGDAISVHAYPWGNTASSVWVSQYSSSLQYYNQLFDSLEVWVTETGQNITDCGGNEQLQAQYLSDSLNFFNGKVSHVFWYALYDDNSIMGDFGLIQGAVNPRSCYTELRALLV